MTKLPKSAIPTNAWLKCRQPQILQWWVKNQIKFILLTKKLADISNYNSFEDELGAIMAIESTMCAHGLFFGDTNSNHLPNIKRCILDLFIVLDEEDELTVQHSPLLNPPGVYLAVSVPGLLIIKMIKKSWKKRKQVLDEEDDADLEELDDIGL
ncbi:hypothetical protein OG21DRAFT_1526440 [Imleria badia]|nr:hypothetical protein OG21DRAFT_1526440 [Imleria badia]